MVLDALDHFVKERLRARQWYEKAVGDLEAARACLDSARVPTWKGGFHVQQAVEKALNGRVPEGR